ERAGGGEDRVEAGRVEGVAQAIVDGREALDGNRGLGLCDAAADLGEDRLARGGGACDDAAVGEGELAVRDVQGRDGLGVEAAVVSIADDADDLARVGPLEGRPNALAEGI